jgi:hypothetical protein
VGINAQGVASFTIANPSVGTHYVQAVYGGDANYNFASTPNVTGISVIKSNTTTTDIPSATTINVGTAIGFTAVVAPVAPGAGTPTGSVQFFVDGILAMTSSVNSQGQAAFVTTGLSVGVHSIVATYLGDIDFNASMVPAAIFVTVNDVGRRT